MVKFAMDVNRISIDRLDNTHNARSLTQHRVKDKKDNAQNAHATAQRRDIDKDNIRNFCVIAPSGQDKATPIHSLLESAGTVKEVPSDTRSTRASALTQEASASIDHKSISIPLLYEVTKVQGDRERFLFNLIQTLGYTDLPAEPTDSLCMSDGALVVVDCTEGFVVHREILIQHALRERIRPVLCLNLIDRFFLNSEIDGEEVYQILFRAIKDVNAVMSTWKDKLLVDVKVYPEKGSVAFASDICGLGFTLRQFTENYAHHPRIDEAVMLERVWGDNLFDSETNKWTSKNSGPSCKRGFVKLCYEPIKELLDICMSNDKHRLWNALDQRGLALKEDEYQLEGKDLLSCVMKLWLPANTSVLEMMIGQLPSPVKAQEYRVENLYRGPLNDSYATAIRKCDPDGPLVIYISKMIRSSNKAMSFAFGRVFSGKVESGMRVRIMGSTHVPGQKDYYAGHILRIAVFKGDKLEAAEIVRCGNMVALVGLNKCIPKNATITMGNVLHAFPLQAISVDIQHGLSIPDISLKFIGNSKMENFRLPYLVYDELFLHQREGIRWLWSMHCQESGGIPADDMGLGKTRQICTFLCGLFYSGLIKRALIVASPSVIDPWGRELNSVGITNIKKFTDARTEKHLKEVVMGGGLLCTTYGMISKVEKFLSDVDVETWDYLFMYEGHCDKNRKAGISKFLKEMRCNHKIIITGTPMQNNLSEFQSLMEICKPSLLGDHDTFHANYTLPIDRGKHRDAKPDLKRRSCQILSIARDICRHPCLLMQNYSSEEKLSENDNAVAIQMKSSLFKMYPPNVLCEENLNISSKLDFILYLVRKLYEEKHKILVFSQSPHMLKILEKALGKVIEREKIIRMDGSTKRRDRNKMIMAFQGDVEAKSQEFPHSMSESSQSSNSTSSDVELSKVHQPLIFLMTTRVGGVGLNLTAATRVIIADPSENPSDDNQAVDRAYRMGQTDDVIVYRLVTCAVIEEHTYREQILKIETSFGVLGEEPRMKSVCKKEGRVLCVPPFSYNVCKTDRELFRIYGSKIRINSSSLNLHHKSVIIVNNHSLLYSVKEDNEDQEDQHPNIIQGTSKKQKPKLKETKKDETIQSIQIELPSEAVTRLLANRQSLLKKMQRATEAAMDVVRQKMLISSCDWQEIEKAQKLVHDFVVEIKSEKKHFIYIPEGKAGVVIGRKGVTITSISESSQASIKVKDPERGRKDLEGQKVVEICGKLQKVLAARVMILKKLEESGITYTIEEDT